jgi:hypothetical protein
MGYTLSDIVNELLIELGMGQNNQFARFYQFGLSYLRRVNMDTSGFPKIVELDINSNDTADLPSDYIQYSKIALCVNGRLISLGLNNNLCLDKNYDDCGNVATCSSCGSANCNCGSSSTTFTNTFGGALGQGNPMAFADTTRNGESLGRMFGIGSDNNLIGQFRIDKNSNQIKLSGLCHTATVVMEYLADVNAQDGDFEVHLYMIEAIKDWMAWKYKQRSSKPLGEQQMAHEDFKRSHRLMQQRFASSTLQEFIEAFQSGNSAIPKMSTGNFGGGGFGGNSNANCTPASSSSLTTAGRSFDGSFDESFG